MSRPSPLANDALTPSNVSSSARATGTALSRSVLGFGGAVALVAGLATLSGCPIYAYNSCSEDPSCNPPTNAEADAGVTPTTDAGTSNGCGNGCSAGYSCTNFGAQQYSCVPVDCRAAEIPCATGQTCTEGSDGSYSCATSGPVDCATTGCIAGMACTTLSSGAHQCVSTNPNACVTDSDCPGKTGAGSLCLGGICTAQKDVCSDSTQCSNGGDCIDGRCIPKCASSCATGYACDANGSCTGGLSACNSSAGTVCGTGTSCVNTRCVGTCATDGSCPSGEVCVAGGCVINDRPTFFCDTAGTADGTQDTCKSGSICLHHNCYIACSLGGGDAGTDGGTSCATADSFNVCKAVTDATGTYDVCASSTNLGSECDPTNPTAPKCASGQACIDGFCR